MHRNVSAMWSTINSRDIDENGINLEFIYLDPYSIDKHKSRDIY